MNYINDASTKETQDRLVKNWKRLAVASLLLRAAQMSANDAERLKNEATIMHRDYVVYC